MPHQGVVAYVLLFAVCMTKASFTEHVAPLTRTAEELWWAIEVSVREACVLRIERREPEAIMILQQELPQLIEPWSRNTGLPSAVCQQKLRLLFTRVQQEVATALVCKRLVLQSIAPGKGRHGEMSESVHVNRNVPLDDIPDMLDALEEGERTAAFRRQHFHSAAHRPLLAAAGNRSLSASTIH